MADDFTIKDFHVAEGVENWRVVSDGGCAFYATASLAASARLSRPSAESMVSPNTRQTSTFAMTA